MENVARYSTRIAYSAEDEGYIATVPELPGCSAFGVTQAEALNEIGPAIEAWISAAEAAGNPVPPPAAIDDELPSGKFMVRVAKTIHAQLSSAAQREGVSLNQYVGTILATATLGDIYSRAAASVSYASMGSMPGGVVVKPNMRSSGFYERILTTDRNLAGWMSMRLSDLPIVGVQARTEPPVLITTVKKGPLKKGHKKAAVHG